MARFGNTSERWRSSAVVLAMVVMLTGLNALADDMGGPPTLKQLMAQLFADLETLNDGLLHSDFQGAANAADRIADHPMVKPAQRAAIAGTLGKEMATFKGYDTTVHDAAQALSEAARRGDDVDVVRRYGELMGGCVGCHARFRDRVREALGTR